MACQECGDDDRLLNACNYCGQQHCSEHVLPENHDCPGLYQSDSFGPDFRNIVSRVTGSIAVSKSGDVSDADYSSGSSTDSTPDATGDGAGPEQSSDGQSIGYLAMAHRALVGGRASRTYRGLCPHCDQYIRRRQGQRITKCLNCGWKPGWPLLRGVSHYPAWKHYIATLYAISVQATKVGIVLAAIIGTIAVTVGTGMPIIDDTADSMADAAGEVVAGVSTPEGESPTSERAAADSTTPTPNSGNAPAGLDENRLEMLIHQEINERRRAHELDSLAWDDRLSTIANSHSENMVRQGFYAHEAPNGSDFSDRYSRRGYNCEVDINGDRYAIGAENILLTYYQTELTGDRYYATPAELAEGAVNSWMNSPGHRENILREYWNNEGIGVATKQTEDGLAVYVTQNFC